MLISTCELSAGLTLIGYILGSTLCGYITYKLIDFIVRCPILDPAGRFVLVTGCDTGFGQRLVECLHAKGCNVIATCLTLEGMVALKEFGTRVKVIHMDVSKSESIQKAYRQALDFIPTDTGLWGIVNNSGISGILGPSDWLQREDFEYVLNVNVLGMIDVVNTWLPLLEKAGGRIVNMASMLGRVSIPYSSAYCMSKFAVQAYSCALRRELLRSAVSVHIVEPGAFRTNFTDSARILASSRKAWSRLPQAKRDVYGDHFVGQMVANGVRIMNITMSSNKDTVVDAYQHALFARHPRRRYRVGMDSIIYLLVSYLPDWMTDLGFKLSGLLPYKANIKKTS